MDLRGWEGDVVQMDGVKPWCSVKQEVSQWVAAGWHALARMEETHVFAAGAGPRECLAARQWLGVGRHCGHHCGCYCGDSVSQLQMGRQRQYRRYRQHWRCGGD